MGVDFGFGWSITPVMIKPLSRTGLLGRPERCSRILLPIIFANKNYTLNLLDRID